MLDGQIPELLGHITKHRHAMVECEVPEKDRPRFHHVRVVLEESFFIHVRLVNLALGAILFDEPVVAKRLRVLHARDSNELRRLRLKSLQLTGPDLQVSMHFQMTHDILPTSHALWDVTRTKQAQDLVADVGNRVEHERTPAVDYGDA